MQEPDRIRTPESMDAIIMELRSDSRTLADDLFGGIRAYRSLAKSSTVLALILGLPIIGFLAVYLVRGLLLMEGPPPFPAIIGFLSEFPTSGLPAIFLFFIARRADKSFKRLRQKYSRLAEVWVSLKTPTGNGSLDSMGPILKELETDARTLAPDLVGGIRAYRSFKRVNIVTAIFSGLLFYVFLTGSFTVVSLAISGAFLIVTIASSIYAYLSHKRYSQLGGKYSALIEISAKLGTKD